MLIRHPCALLLLPTLLGLGSFAGCSMTSPGAPRSAARPEIKTIASVGDRPLPPVTGEPGASVVADRFTPEPRRNPANRVSGRVVDDKGRPVANAVVRPAESAASAGRVAETTTDRAGGFTLHGIRAGTRVTLIAEYDTPDGIQTGRIEALSSDTGLEIALSPRGDTSGLGAGEGTFSRSVSNREELDLDAAPSDQRTSRKPRSAGPVNLEDIPTSEEIDAQGDAQTLEDPGRSPAKKVPTTGWRSIGERDPNSPSIKRIGSLSDGLNGPVGKSRLDSDGEAPPANDARSLVPADEAELDEVNPLPPAIDPTAKGGGRTSAINQQSKPRAATVFAREVRGAAESGGMQLAGAESPVPAKVRWDDAPSFRKELVVAEPASPPLAVTQKRMTWDDLLGQTAEKKKTVEGAPAASPRSSSAVALQPSQSNSTFGSFLKGASPPKAQIGREICKYDARNQKITDLRLPNSEGRLVSFNELEADYVLLDFWGSWCQPCLKTIPHLVELQKQFGQRITVVGVACEKGTFEQRANKATAAAQKLGINYPVLVSSAEEHSPVQEALKIQGFPTLILVDRNGKIVWREQGGSPVTMSRLDRVLASTAQADTVRR